MNAIITTAFHSGLGDMYVGLYQIYYLQNELKRIGYNVKTIIDLGVSPYKKSGPNRDVFKKIFKLELLDNLEIIIGGLGELNSSLEKEMILEYKYEQIHTVFVDVRSDLFNTINHIKHSWYYRDDLPKINLLSDEVIEYAENKIKNFGNNYIGLHYRPVASDDQRNHESDLEKYKNTIFDILEENKNTNIFVSTSKDYVKSFLRSLNNKNICLNDYVFPNTADDIRELDLDDDELLIMLNEILSDMYALSKCEKIYRIADWFSAFLSFSCLYNQTAVSNKNRFIPNYPIISI